MDTKNKTEINYLSSREDKIKYMIEVMQADLDGKEIESYSIFEEKWLGIDSLGIAPSLWDFSDWRPDEPSFPLYRIKPGEPKKKAVWSVEYKNGHVVEGFVSLEALLDYLSVTNLTSELNGISRDEWIGAFALSGDGSLIADPYDILEDFKNGQ